MMAGSQPIVSLVISTGWRWLRAFFPKRAILVLCESGRIRKGSRPSRKRVRRATPLAGGAGTSRPWKDHVGDGPQGRTQGR